MLARITFVFLLLAATTAWSQVEPGGSGGATAESDAPMLTPPPVSGQAYPSSTGSEARSNYLSTSVAVNGAYVNNVFPGAGSTPVNDATISVYPSLLLSRTTPRQQLSLTYGPSFVFYQPTSVLDTVDQGAGFRFQDRFSPHLTLSLQDTFFKTSNVFDQSALFTSGTVTGSTQTAAVIDPWAELISNISNAVVSYQFAKDAMVGGGGSYSIIDFPGPTNASAISSSNGGGASAFYNRRLSLKYYAGFNYQYAKTISSSGILTSETQTHSLLPYFTVYFNRTFSASVSAGVQRVLVTLPGSVNSSSWTPSGVVSVGWQTNRADLAANYSRTVSSGEGLFGAFNSSNFGISGNWKMVRTWTLGFSANYAETSNATPGLSTYAGGTTIAGQASITRSFGEHLNVAFGYQNLHQQYSDIPVIAENPNSDQVYGRIAYQFRTPIRK